MENEFYDTSVLTKCSLGWVYVVVYGVSWWIFCFHFGEKCVEVASWAAVKMFYLSWLLYIFILYTQCTQCLH